MNLTSQVREKFKQVRAGGVITSSALHGLSADSQQVDKAVSRLYKTEGLHKLRNGLYYKPYRSKFFGELPPRKEDVIRSVKRQYKAKISPTGALAAYNLGLTSALPDSIIYETDKRISPIELGNYTLYFRKVDSKKLLSVSGLLLCTVSALEYLYKENATLTPLQEERIRRILSRYTKAQLSKACAYWPRWFQEQVLPLISATEKRYITGLSALNIPFKGKQADWHQMGMLNSNKFQITGHNYESAPGLAAQELFDCGEFLAKHGVNVGTELCATPLRAIKDILYTNIIRKNQYPSFFMLDQLMLDIPKSRIKKTLEDLQSLANAAQKRLLIRWAQENELN